jgi:hypothetical protein
MSNINWKRLLDQHGVEYIEKGSSVVKGNIAVHCPMCGNADGGHHMGINLTTSWWGCWRNTQHRGKSPIRLLMALLKVSFAQACDLAGLDERYVDPEGWDSIKHNPFGHDDQVDKSARVTQLRMPDEFREITSAVRTTRFFNYLERRGFPLSTISELCRLYRLRAAVIGDFKDRVIMPYYMDAKLLTWTGRAVGETKMRYLDLAIDKSITPAKQMLYNFNATRRPDKVLLVVEGPMDALKADFFGRMHGVRAVALSTNSMSDSQIYLLEEVSGNFEQIFVVMDNGNSLGVVDSFKMKEKLATIKNIDFLAIRHEYKDFGEMPPDVIVKFCKELI